MALSGFMLVQRFLLILSAFLCWEVNGGILVAWLVSRDPERRASIAFHDLC